MNVGPTDFDGDGCLDVLLVTESQNGASGSKKSVTVHVYWGNLQNLGIIKLMKYNLNTIWSNSVIL